MATYSSIKQSVLEATSIARVIATNYNSVDSLPTSGNAVGEQALVLGDSSTDRLYIWEGSAWYQIALIQNSPTFTTSPDDTYELATDGVTTTVITLAATDPEGFPVTFSAVTNVGFDSIATVSQDSSVFTITPFSEDSAGVSRTGTITFKASDGISVASAISTFTITFKIVNSNYTSTLIKASGNDGTNIAINDASASNRSITLNGDIRTQAFTPFHPGGYSVYTGAADTDYVKLDASTNYNFDNSGWQLEGWLHPEAFDGGAGSIFEFYTDDNNFFRLFKWNYPGFGISGKISGTSYANLGSSNGTQIPTDEWSHFAVTWDGSKLRVYLNGVLEEESNTISTDLTSTLGSQPLYLMQDYVSTDRYIQGYIYDVRLQTGSSAVTYTGSTYTVPTAPLSTDINTKFHLARLPYLGDKKGGTVTFSGNVALKRFAPYDYVAYNPATHGASIYNDGNADYMTVAADTTDLTLNGDFTIDFWYYPVAAKNMGYVYGKWNNQSDGWALWVTPDYSSGNFGYVTFYYGNYGSNECASNLRSTVVTLNQWHYIRVTRSSGTMYMSVNGKVGTRTNYTSGITFTDNRTFNADTTIGITGNSAAGYTLGQAYLSDLRVINGTALTTGDFTPPTSPATAVTNTKLLTCNDAPDVFDATGGERRLKTYGNAKSSTAQTKNADSSIVFDGTGDYVETATDIAYTYGTGDFTIEAWVYVTANPSNYAYILGQGAVVASNASLGLYIQSGVFKVYNNAVVITGTTSYSLNTWHHVVLTRGNGVLSLFLDGSLEGSTTNTNNITTGTAQGPSIGRWAEVGDGGYFAGYVEDLRITKGLSRYPFIPFSETLTSNSDTGVLLCHADTIVDGSSNAASITTSGDPTVSDFGPYPGMKSVYFDGNDYFNLETTALGSGDFTVEGWVYSNDFGDGSYNQIFSFRPSNGASASQGSLAFNGSGGLVWWTSTFIIGSSSNGPHLIDRTWNHFALVRDNGTLKLFVNGTMTNSVANTQNLSEQSLSLGANNNGSEAFPGYISNFRILPGIVQYTNSFTPPTTELIM